MDCSPPGSSVRGIFARILKCLEILIPAQSQEEVCPGQILIIHLSILLNTEAWAATNNCLNWHVI